MLALEVDRNLDLALFSRFLYQQGIAHRINEAGEQQQLWVTNIHDQDRVQQFYAAWQSGELRLEAGSNMPRQGPSTLQRLLNSVWRMPVTGSFVIITLLLYPVTMGLDEGVLNAWFAAMSFLQFELRADGVYFTDLSTTLAGGEYWRLLTPMFLHFGILHVVFNMLWFWEIGRRIELRNGGLLLLVLVLVSSLCSNLLQYKMTGPGFFGGMSGVVFGLLGYSLVWSKLLPQRDMGLPHSIYIFMLGFMVVGFSGLFDLLGLGNLANWAHLGGLLAGAVMGAVAAGVSKSRGGF